MTYTHCFLINIVALAMSACTLSFTNVSTHGTATDTIDQENTPSNRLEVPIGKV